MKHTATKHALLLLIAFVASAAPTRVFAEKAPTTAPYAFAVDVQGRGQPVIFIPGLGCGGEVWDATVEHLADKYETHVLTLAGFAGQPAISSPLLSTVRDDVLRYISDKKLSRPIIIGHSLGGFLSYWIAAQGKGAIGGIIAVDGAPFLPALGDQEATEDSARPQAEAMRAHFKKVSKDDFVKNTRAALTSMIKNPKDIAFVSESSVRSDKNTVANAMFELLTTDLRPLLGSIRIPTLAIASSPLMAPGFKPQLRSIRDHRFVVAPDSKHFIMLDNPMFFYDEMDAFLRKVSK